MGVSVVGTKINSQVLNDNFSYLEEAIEAEGVNVQKYGVKGDGIADDTANILLGLASIAVGDTLRLPKGNYVISNTITLPAGKHWKMEPGAVLLPNGNFDVFIYSGGRSVVDGLYVKLDSVAFVYGKTVLSIPIKGANSHGRIENVKVSKKIEATDTSSVAIGFTHDGTATGNDYVVYAGFRNIKAAGFYYGIYIKIITTTSGNSPWTTACNFNNVILESCKRSIHLESQNSASLGLQSGFTFDNVQLQSISTTDYHIKLSGVQLNRITNLIIWDWYLSAGSNNKKSIILESGSLGNYIETDKKQLIGYSDANARFKNTVKVLDEPRSSNNDRAAISAIVPVTINSKASDYHYAGQQDNSLAFADKRWTVNVFDRDTLAPITVTNLGYMFSLIKNGVSTLNNVLGKNVVIELDFTTGKAKDNPSVNDAVMTPIGISYQLGTGGTPPPSTDIEVFKTSTGAWSFPIVAEWRDFHVTESPTYDAAYGIPDAHMWVTTDVTIDGQKIRFHITNITTTNLNIKHIFGLDTRRRGNAYPSMGDPNSMFHDMYFEDNVRGVVLRSPDNSYWRIKVDNAGALTTLKI